MAKAQNTNIEIIIPLHEYNEKVKPLLVRAIESVPQEYHIYIATTVDTSALLLEDKDVVANRKNVDIVSSPDKSDFCSLVTMGVNTVTTPYFSILEYDDEYTSIWFNNVENYMKFKPEVSVFLPLNDLVDAKDDTFVGYGNEAAWASSFSNEIGYIDNDCLQNFFDFYMTGGVFNKDDFTSVGGLKPSMKLSFWYEFLLRITNKGKLIYVIPKIGYQHYLNREGSLFWHYREEMSEKECKFWIELAKKECFFSNDRGKQYNAEEEEEED